MKLNDEKTSRTIGFHHIFFLDQDQDIFILSVFL